ncbi:hypothetical protein ACH5RR_018708 [Cinchona calisaya]|uniref:F-box domain-containing protein n=1 Tax=Cinchona calisaya TaxID=153742 RepID=A0ABD2ZM81_9GENT
MDGRITNRPKKSVGGEDRIGNLPESILSHILSRLPTTDQAVRTSVLSRKWEYKWTCIYNLTFDDRKRAQYSKKLRRPEKADFMKFVDRVLVLCKNTNIQKLELLFSEHYDPFRMKTWITAALTSTVQRLCISYEGDLVLAPRTESPWSLPIFDKLTHLKVYSAGMAIECNEPLIDFLKMTPALESLKFTGRYSPKAADNYDGIELVHGDFLSCLKVVKLEYYHTSPRDSPLVKFLLLNAVELEELLIYWQHEGLEVDKGQNQLLKFQRASNHVSIVSS